MRLAAQVLEQVHIVETKVDREAKNRYMTLPGLRKFPYEPYSPEEWDAMAKSLTNKYADSTETAINFSDVHFELERAAVKDIQLPIVNRMLDLALADRSTLKKIRRIVSKFSELQRSMGKTYDAQNARFGRDFAKRGGMDVHSKSMGIWLIGTITGEMPPWATDKCKQTWKFLTCSDKKDFKPYKDDEITQVERNQGVMRLTIEVE